MENKKQIIYGIGRAVLRDFTDKKKIIDYTDLQDVSFESSYSKEDITGGNKLFPIASFKKDTAVKVSATNATFHPEMIEYMDGATTKVGSAQMMDIKEVLIPADGVVTLDYKPVNGTVLVKGFESTETTPAAGKFVVASASKTVTFATADANKSIVILYEYMGSTSTTNYSITQASMSKPFEFDYLFDIYDDNSQITHKGLIKVYKMQTTSGFSIDPKHQSAVAPKFEAEAKDPLRSDGHLWDFFIDGVAVA